MLTINCKPEQKAFYHGTSSNCSIGHMLLPPCESGTISEKGRLKNLDKVFFTGDLNSAKVYAGRASRQFGGSQVIYKVFPVGEIVCLNSNQGTTVYHANWAFVEIL